MLLTQPNTMGCVLRGNFTTKDCDRLRQLHNQFVGKELRDEY